jgi:tetratricopeptide (TPR) repeat protein
MNRKERRASGRRGAAGAFSSAATPAQAPPLGELFGAAVANHRAGALAEAELRYKEILTYFPDHAESHGMLGVALFTQGKVDEALPHFERTVALKPDLAGAYDDLGKAYLAAAKPEFAIQAAARALELGETERRKAFFAHCAKFVVFTTDSDRFRRLLRRALVEAWARPRELVRACASLISLDRTVNDAIARARSAWPHRLAATELLGPPGIAALSRDELLCRLLECDPVTDIGLERLLTSVRYAMLTSAADSP